MHIETRRLLKDPWPELVFGLTAAVGADVDGLVDLLDKLLKQYRYKSRTMRLSDLLSKVDPNWLGVTLDTSSEFQRIWTHMNAGDALRKKTESGEALAVWSIGDINSERAEGSAGKEPLKAEQPLKGVAHILRTIKHPDEVRLLREVYKSGFYLIALHASEEARFARLTSLHGVTSDEARRLISRDQGDAEPDYGQQTRDTFQMADVFILQDSSKMQDQLDRFLRLVFGDPLTTPTRDEHAMFMAYAASLRSADLSDKWARSFVEMVSGLSPPAPMMFLPLAEGSIGRMIRNMTSVTTDILVPRVAKSATIRTSDTSARSQTKSQKRFARMFHRACTRWWMHASPVGSTRTLTPRRKRCLLVKL